MKKDAKKKKMPKLKIHFAFHLPFSLSVTASFPTLLTPTVWYRVRGLGLADT